MKTAEIQKAKLIRRYHTLCTKIGMSEEERRGMLVSNYGVESSKDLYVEELVHICRVLDDEVNRKEVKLQQARKRVFGAVGGWLDSIYGKVAKNDILKYRERIDKIKAIACRQTEHADFNKIPVERLNNVSYLFSKKQKDLKAGEILINDELQKIASLN